MKDNLNLILGTMTIGEQIFGEDATELIKRFRKHGYRELDTAYVYNNGECERIIGNSLKQLNDNGIIVSTKVNPRISGKLDSDAVFSQFGESLLRMNVSSVNTLYLHFPDQNTPIDSALAACNKLYEEKKIKEIGLSNFPAWLVVEVIFKCKMNGWIEPTVYEGLYNPLSRKAEGELNEVLDKYNIRFNAYNPLAGGMLTNKYNGKTDVPTEGRFINRPNYQQRYWLDSYFDAVELIKEECQRQDVSIIEVAYRWLAYHSMLNAERGDGIIIGASKVYQIEQNIVALNNGPLSDDMVEVINDAWEICKKDAPEYYRFYKANK